MTTEARVHRYSETLARVSSSPEGVFSSTHHLKLKVGCPVIQGVFPSTHQLKLKVGCPVILLRNILPDGTRKASSCLRNRPWKKGLKAGLLISERGTRVISKWLKIIESVSGNTSSSSWRRMSIGRYWTPFNRISSHSRLVPTPTFSFIANRHGRRQSAVLLGRERLSRAIRTPKRV